MFHPDLNLHKLTLVLYVIPLPAQIGYHKIGYHDMAKSTESDIKQQQINKHNTLLSIDSNNLAVTIWI